NYIVPNISVPVSYVALLAGSSVTLRCVLNEVGNPKATIKWTFAGSVITNNSLFLITEGSTRLNITSITTSYSGAYHCNASNVAGASVATINVDVQEPPYFIVTPPHNVSVRYDNAITLNCSSGGVPLPNITWFKDGIVIPTDQYTSSNTSDTLITMLTVVGSLTSLGYFTCQAVNDLVERRVISTTVNVTVFEPLSYAGIDPSSSITLNQSDTFTADCSFSGLPLPVVSWYFLNKFLSNIGRVTITTDTQDITVTSTLRIRNVKKSTDEGVYHCIGIQASTYNFVTIAVKLVIL
uniref:Ig-like domain-containing protein n=1 Tax=Amphimedon queenslandica TaxID=400682 RepID=A0A1X7SKR7_AMPQE